MATTDERAVAAERLKAIWEPPETLYFRLATVDHKKIGMRYLTTAFVFLLLGGLEALVMRTQLAAPGNHLLSPEAYDQLFTMHGVTMIWWYASPILSGFSNYLIPLLIGSRDMAFPRLNAFSYWSFLLSGVVLYSGFLLGLGPHGGWFAYPPYTGPIYSPGLNLDFYCLALLFLTISTTAGAINFIVTILKMRCPGMSISRMPLLNWSTLTVSLASLFALPPLTVALLFLELERRYGLSFYDPVHGSPLLWQHLFWVFGHPWVYIVILPATGMVSMILPTFCRRPIVGHTYVALATAATGIAGFGVWVHHMFATGIPELPLSFFSAGSMTVTIPSGIQFFAWLATIWYARSHLYKAPFLFLLGFLFLFVMGGVNGVMLASPPADWQETDTYFVVAHLHYVLVGINLFPVIAGFYYWLPKMTGRLLHETLAKWNFWLMFIGSNLLYFPMHVLGMLGMQRRVYTYPDLPGWGALNLVETIGGFMLAAGVLVFVWNVVLSRKSGLPAGDNPWGASSLEWSVSSPPPGYNFLTIPTVVSREPLWDAHEESADPRRERVLDHGKETISTSLLYGEPERLDVMPEDTLYPLGLALALAVLFYGGIFKIEWLGMVGLVLTGAALWGWLWPEPKLYPPEEPRA